MKPNELKKQVINSGYNLQADMPMGHLNGFLVVIDPRGVAPQADLIKHLRAFRECINRTIVQCKYYHKSGNDVLIPNIPLSVFLDISEQKFGSTGYKNLIRLIDELDALELQLEAGTITQDAYDEQVDVLSQIVSSNTSQSTPIVSLYIPIGSILLETGDTMVIDLETTSDFFNQQPVGAMTVCALSIDDYEYFNVIEYDITANHNDVHSQVQETYILNEDNVDFEVTVDSITSDYSCEKTILTSLASLFKETENYVEQRTLPVFQAQNSVPEDVHLKLISSNGAPLTNTRVFNVRKFSSIEKFLEQRQNFTNKAVELVRKGMLNEKSKDLIKVVGSESVK